MLLVQVMPLQLKYALHTNGLGRPNGDRDEWWCCEFRVMSV